MLLFNVKLLLLKLLGHGLSRYIIASCHKKSYWPTIVDFSEVDWDNLNASLWDAIFDTYFVNNKCVTMWLRHGWISIIVIHPSS